MKRLEPSPSLYSDGQKPTDIDTEHEMHEAGIPPQMWPELDIHINEAVVFGTDALPTSRSVRLGTVLRNAYHAAQEIPDPDLNIPTSSEATENFKKAEKFLTTPVDFGPQRLPRIQVCDYPELMDARWENFKAARHPAFQAFDKIRRLNSARATANMGHATPVHKTLSPTELRQLRNELILCYDNGKTLRNLVTENIKSGRQALAAAS